jgi:hypothetical protein
MLNYEIHHGKVVKAIPRPGFIIARRYPLASSPKFDAKVLVGIETLMSNLGEVPTLAPDAHLSWRTAPGSAGEAEGDKEYK